MKKREEENMIQHETNETWAAALDPQHLQKLETDFIFLSASFSFGVFAGSRVSDPVTKRIFLHFVSCLRVGLLCDVLHTCRLLDSIVGKVLRHGLLRYIL